MFRKPRKKRGNITVTNGSIYVGGDITVRATNGGIAALRVGNLSIDNRGSMDYSDDKLLYSVKSYGNDLNLIRNESDRPEFLGDIGDMDITNNKTHISGYDGIIGLPEEHNPDLTMLLHTTSGSVIGMISQGAEISTDSGNIHLELYSPLEVKASSRTGVVEVRNMMQDGNGAYVPCVRSIGELVLSSQSGDIRVDYKG